MDGPHSFHDFGLCGSEMRGSPIFRIREMPNPDMPMGFPIRIFSQRPRFLPRIPSIWTVHIHFVKSNAEISRHPILLILKVSNSEMPMALDLHHVSQPMDGSDLFQGSPDVRLLLLTSPSHSQPPMCRSDVSWLHNGAFHLVGVSDFAFLKCACFLSLGFLIS
jgi:hypothetical protein